MWLAPLFDNNVTAQSLCSWREKRLGLRRAEKGQLGAVHRLCQDMFQQAAEMVETCRNRRRNPSRHLPMWGLLLTGHLLADVHYLRRWGGAVAGSDRVLC